MRESIDNNSQWAIATSKWRTRLITSLVGKNPNSAAMTKNHFIFHYAIGRGGFGKVWKVESKKGKQLFAMKEMSKARIISKRSVHSVINERNILT